MAEHAPDNSRRRFIKLTAIGLAAAPFANALLSGAASAADAVSESDPQATALGYVADATKAAKAISAKLVFPVFDGLPGADDAELKLTLDAAERAFAALK